MPSPSAQPLLCPVLWLLLCLLPTTAMARLVDHALLDRLEQAVGREQVDVARDIRERLKRGRPPADVQQRLITLVGTSQVLIDSGQVNLLYFLRPGRELDPASVVAAAAALAAEVNQKAGSGGELAALLSDVEDAGSLPAAAMEHLYRAAADGAWANAAYAILVLRRVPADDPRFASSARAVAHGLDQGQAWTRDQTGRALAAMGAQGALPSPAIDALIHTALNDELVHVRLEAFAALATQALPDEERLTTALATLLADPKDPLWQTSRGYSGSGQPPERAVEILMGWVSPPHAEMVVDALVAQTAGYRTTALPWLEAIANAQGLTTAQTAALQRAAQGLEPESARRRLYNLLALVQPALPLDEALAALRNDNSLQMQLRAAYQLDRTWPQPPLPDEVVEAARHTLMASRHQDVRALAARLVAKARATRGERQGVLFRAMAEHPYDQGIAEAWLGMFSDDEWADLVAQHVGNSARTPGLRYQLVSRLTELATTDQALPEATRAALVEAGASTDHYSLNSAIVQALEAWGEWVPLRVWLANKQVLGSLLFTLYAALGLVFACGTLANLALVVGAPVATARRQRLALLLLWVMLSLLGLVAFAFAFIGFLGHNSTPDPREAVLLHLPLYGLMLLFVGYTVFVVRWARNRRAAAA